MPCAQPRSPAVLPSAGAAALHCRPWRLGVLQAGGSEEKARLSRAGAASPRASCARSRRWASRAALGSCLCAVLGGSAVLCRAPEQISLWQRAARL